MLAMIQGMQKGAESASLPSKQFSAYYVGDAAGVRIAGAFCRRSHCVGDGKGLEA